jgi:hypothetical protein
MKASDVLRLQTWVQNKREWIVLEQPTQNQMKSQAAIDLAIKVSVNALRDVLVANGIQIRRTVNLAEVAVLREEVDNLNKILVKVITAATVPEWLRKELETEKLAEEVREAVARNRSGNARQLAAAS